MELEPTGRSTILFRRDRPLSDGCGEDWPDFIASPHFGLCGLATNCNFSAHFQEDKGDSSPAVGHLFGKWRLFLALCWDQTCDSVGWEMEFGLSVKTAPRKAGLSPTHNFSPGPVQTFSLGATAGVLLGQTEIFRPRINSLPSFEPWSNHPLKKTFDSLCSAKGFPIIKRRVR